MAKNKPKLDLLKDKPESQEYANNLRYLIKGLIYQYKGSVHREMLPDLEQHLFLRVLERIKDRPYDESYGISYTSYLHAIIRNGISNYFYHYNKKLKYYDPDTKYEEHHFYLFLSDKIWLKKLASIFKLDLALIEENLHICTRYEDFDEDYYNSLSPNTRALIKVCLWEFYKDQKQKNNNKEYRI